MGYYRGDFYRGDGGNYYRGDPFLGGIIAGAAGKLVGKAARFIGRKVGGRARAAGQALAPIMRDAAPGMVGGAAGYTIGRLPQLSPSAPMGPLFDEKKKYRRMNPLNPRALRRALRRAEGFEKFAKRTVNALYKTVDGRRVRSFKKRKSS